MRHRDSRRSFTSRKRNGDGSTARRALGINLGRSLQIESLEDRDLLAALSIYDENQLTGNPSSEWDVGFGSTNIEGFATEMSVDQGETIDFKIKTNATNYRIDIYRSGYYGGLGARKVDTIYPDVSLPQTQPTAFVDESLGMADAGNWSVSAHWDVPDDATSGVYLANLVRTDGTAGKSQVVFVVRDDDGASDIMYKTSDTTWQAYNRWGGKSLYANGGTPRGYGVSYNRPMDYNIRSYNGVSFYFGTEYPMVRYMERNGYDVSYVASADVAKAPTSLLDHELFVTSGHDEYWSAEERDAVEAARDAGVDLGFFGGNDIFWKTYWDESSFDSNAPNRTLISYKSTHANANIDPVNPQIWTGTWRDPRFSPPADGFQPENALIGTAFMVNSDNTSRTMTVPGSMAGLRFWRNTDIADNLPNQTETLTSNIIGPEWNEDVDNGFRPAGVIRLSSTTLSTSQYLQDHGSNFGNGTSTHTLTMYRAASGALVFSAGSQQFVFALDDKHDGVTPAVDDNLQQAIVNLFADMGVQPDSLMSGLVAATASTDSTAPSSAITSPSNNASLTPGTPITITGTASDSGGGVVAAVEVSIDGGLTWHLASGLTSWSYSWTPRTVGQTTIRSRAVDDSGNVETAGSGVIVNPQGSGPYSLFGSTAPSVSASSESLAIELGVRFKADTNGYISSVRFYKASNNTGTHTGSLWTADGQLLSTATFTSETSSGWQQVDFATPVAVTAGTTYVASYHTNTGHYYKTAGYFSKWGADSGPLHAMPEGPGGHNGVFLYGTGGFPLNNSEAGNYWVDVIFTTTTLADTTAPTVTGFNPANSTTNVATLATLSVTFNEKMHAGTITPTTLFLRDANNVVVPAAVSYDYLTQTATLTTTAALANSTTYTIVIKGGGSGVRDLAGNALASDATSSFTTIATTPPAFSFWSQAATPATVDSADTDAIEVGLKFVPATDGRITSLWFYKASTNTGSHVGSLWSADGQLLARGTFANETSSGWQELVLATPYPVKAGTTYIASYHTNVGRYSKNANYFNSPYQAGPLSVPAGGGVYAYGWGGFPTNTFQATNYWIDVEFASTDTAPPSVTTYSPANGITNVAGDTTVTVTFGEALDASTVTTSTIYLRDPNNYVVPANVSYNSTNKTVTITPTAMLAGSTTFTIVIESGAGGVKDLAGNILSADLTSSFTTGVTSFGLWSRATTPGTLDSGDASAVELGVKFTPATSGNIVSLWFYKATTNTGTHVAHLWSSGGTLLASATFTGETASGWQKVDFASPVAVTGGTTYVASYHAPSGHYSRNLNYFGSAYTNGPLSTPSNAGVYVYTGTGAFPSNTFQGSNYWVDVTFVSSDTTPPTVTLFSPTTSATSVPTNTAITVTLGEVMTQSTVNSSTVYLRDSNNVTIATSFAYNPTTKTVTLTPTSALANGATYTIVVKAGPGGVKDLVGNQLISDLISSFTTI